MKTVILGVHGQLGQELQQTLSGNVVGLGRADADLTEPTTLRTMLHAQQPNIVVNCAAYNFVDRAEDEPSTAFAVNALGVRAIAAACAELDCVLVHFSTDHVFGIDGERRAPYAEADAPGPVSVYGASKLAGEYFVRALCRRHFVIRTCGLYGVRGQGGKGSNFVEAILKRATGGLPLRVVHDQACTPTAAADLARAVAALVANDAYGLYHLTNDGSCTWFEFAEAIVRERGLHAAPTPIASAEYGARACRPRYSVLDCGAYARLGLPAMRPWQNALKEYLATRQK